MSGPRRRLKYAARSLLIAAASVLGISLSGRTRFFHLLHLKAGDLQFLLRGVKQPRGITLIVIDQKSLDTFREPLLFWHPYYAEAIRAAAGAGAKIFGLDVEFAIPVNQWAPDHDRTLWQAAYEVSGRMPVICGYVPSTLARQGDWPVQLNMWASTVGLAGFLNLRVDADDFVRGIELDEAPSGSMPRAEPGAADG